MTLTNNKLKKIINYTICILISIIILIFGVSIAFAVPSISSLSGTIGDGNALTISGSDFYAHPDTNQKVGWFADFEGGIVSVDTSLSKGTGFNTATNSCFSVQTSTVAEGTYAIETDITSTCVGFVESAIHLNSSDGFGFGLSDYLTWSIHRYHDTTDTDRSENYKNFRIAEDDNDFYPNFWIGESPDDTTKINTEICNDGKWIGSYIEPTNSWIQDGFFGQRESTNYGKDGHVYTFQNGQVTGSSTTWGFNCDSGDAQDTGPMNYFYIGTDLSNDRESTTGNEYIDYVYIDTMTPMVIMFTDASTIGGSTKFWPQPYTAMSATEITIEQKFANLGSDPANIYVYACKSGTCSSGVQLSATGGTKDVTVSGSLTLKGNVTIK